MREILFRGKCVDNGVWVTGYYWSNEFGKHFIRRPKAPNGRFSISDREVDPATVGQYTGLTDKNGVKVFEGDVLRYGEETYYVSWSNDDCGYQKTSIDDGTPVQESFEWFYAGHSEVVGNIFDNPEPMEVQE